MAVVSGYPDKDDKVWRDKNLSGCYHMVEIVNDRPAYKVSFCYSQEKLATKGLLLLNFSETKTLKMGWQMANGLAKKYIFGITRR